MNKDNLNTPKSTPESSTQQKTPEQLENERMDMIMLQSLLSGRHQPPLRSNKYRKSKSE